ncbi:hypothetical protein DPEC_G00264030 [Dallia pectoralis]|uniref:Uncharacterized protein n=1 Tax=Dallia pectoralis TaxID=75939 RepID=A0ACC2FSD1_DALPE|nr:hypothetical protein DPEC_G00264030 [Dallia pectoralis]
MPEHQKLHCAECERHVNRSLPCLAFYTVSLWEPSLSPWSPGADSKAVLILDIQGFFEGHILIELPKGKGQHYNKLMEKRKSLGTWCFRGSWGPEGMEAGSSLLFD